jgi:hypothetical protein
MKPIEEHAVLVAVATTIADGHPVDWESLIREHPELEADLRALQVLGQIEQARRGEPERR